MAWPGRFFADDEELGKKNDDHRGSNSSTISTAWSVRKPAPAVRKRRVIFIICALLFIYLFVKNVPSDLGPHPRWADTRVNRGPNEGNFAKSSTDPPSKKPPRQSTPPEAEEHYHNGPIKFYKLASSLHSAAKLGGQKEVNKNVMFAAASLRSASELITLACEMSRWERSDVHFAVMGREDMEVEEIQKLNGASREDCNVHWHDARPDYSRWSSDFRMEASVAASLGHIQEFIHPQVIIVDQPSREDKYFITAVRGRAMDLLKPVIELPLDATENLMWMARLDSASLAAWPQTYVDILVQAPSHSSASLVRLLKSIEDADYFGARRPHLTIELPAEVDQPTWKYLENLIWPPRDWTGAPHVSQVSLRHRIPRRTLTPEEASARLVEAFYPVRTTSSHVLLLSSQTELSPLYYHYLLYTLLEYKYSVHATISRNSAKVMGISLDLPTAFLNDSTNFKPPWKEMSVLKGPDALIAEQTPFLWQAPNNNAALYFGEKWMEFHSFLTARLSKPPKTSPKLVSEKHPSWLEYMLELMRARGWSLLYPGLFADDIALATVHDELYQVPEEFSRKAALTGTPTPSLSPDQLLEADPSLQAHKAPPNTEHRLLESSLTSLLPNKGDLPDIDQVALVSYDGELISAEDSKAAATSFLEEFRQSVGTCDPGELPAPYKWTSAADLFCHLDDVYDHHAAAGSLSMGQNHPASGPISKTGEPLDPDMISPVDAQTAKLEAMNHLRRQAGAPKSSEDDASQAERNADTKIKDSYAGRGDGDPESSREGAAQDERKAQMEPQSKPATESKKKTGLASANEAEPKRSQKSAKEAPKPEDKAKIEDSQTKALHGAFNKEKPKPPDEKEIEVSGGRSPGW
ncbi:MAG: hypothetical protein Q9163_001950 [Psora crenata]